MIIHLTDRSLISVKGAGARTFLQGIITNDVQLLETEGAIFSALLSPQGKFLHDFFLTQDGEDLLLETESRQIEGLLKLLIMYRLRAKVTFTPLPEWRVYANCYPERSEGSLNTAPDSSAAPQNNSALISLKDPRHPDMGIRLYAPSPLLYPTQPLQAYETHRLTVGIPEGWKDAIHGRSFLLEMGYDKLHAVDFTKGCYVGQEVTARSRFRAELRKSIHRVTATAPLPPLGTEITTAENITAGEMRSSSGIHGLAMIRHEAMAQGARCFCAGNEVILAPL
jgi:tRNA-modifying protein YgfZ